jgi:hypothetical protein
MVRHKKATPEVPSLQAALSAEPSAPQPSSPSVIVAPMVAVVVVGR